MGFTFGTKKSEVKESDGVYLRSFKKGETKVRFLQEPGEWFAYREHFDPGLNKSFPCMQDNKDVCPGCTSDNERVQNNPRRYGTYVYLVDTEKVLPFKVTQRLSDRLQVRAERNENTLLSRDYIIIRSGAGLDTDYDVDQDDRYPVDTGALWKQRGELEVSQIVEHQFIEAFGDPELFVKNSTNAEPKPSPDSPKAQSTTRIGEEQPPWEKSGMDTFVKTDEVTEQQLLNMSRSELRGVWLQANFPAAEWSDDWSKKEAVAELLKRAD